MKLQAIFHLTHYLVHPLMLVLQATGDVVAVVHADVIVSPGTFDRVLELLQRNPDVIGGAVGSQFDGRGWALRIIEIANLLRAGFLGIAFGDQVQFFRRAPVVSAGLVPDQPLMEDVELSLRLRRLGRTFFLWGDARVSARRWRTNAARRSHRIVALVLRYLVERRWMTPDSAAMYGKYYRSC